MRGEQSEVFFFTFETFFFSVSLFPVLAVSPLAMTMSMLVPLLWLSLMIMVIILMVVMVIMMIMMIVMMVTTTTIIMMMMMMNDVSCVRRVS